MSDESMPRDSEDMQDMVTDDAEASSSSSLGQAAQLVGSEDFFPGNRLMVPIDVCTHCMSHSGVPNAPISSVSIADRSNKDFGPVLSVSKFLIQPLMTLAQIGLPGEHAPPGTSVPRHILINVFLI